MFTRLMESGSRPRRSVRGAALSFVAHYGLILAGLYTSAQAKVPDTRPRVEKIDFVEPERAEPADPKTHAPELIAPLPPRVTTTLMAPLEIPTELPDIDLRQAPTDESLFDGRRGSVRAPSRDSIVAVGPSSDQPYLDFQVDKPVTQAPNSASPEYPDVLRRAGVEGEALVSFVVDTLGRVDMNSFKVLRASHDLFVTAVRNALPRMRFFPAETANGKVRQLVQQPFTFSIVK